MSRYLIVPEEPIYSWKDLTTREPDENEGEWTLQRFINEILLADSAIGQGDAVWEAVEEISDAVNTAYEQAENDGVGSPAYIEITGAQYEMLCQAATRKTKRGDPVASTRLLNPAKLASLRRFSKAIVDAPSKLPDELVDDSDADEPTDLPDADAAND